ncbi:MAG: hypothetical protein HRU26_04330 [Psychroserpens sp.]|nr:hypothetical protein [Psychroserpens sp.]
MYQKSDTNPEELVKLYESLKVDRDNMYSIWEECRFYFNSEKQLMQPNNSGSKQIEQSTPLNPVGYDASMRFASGLFSNTYSAGDQFFSFKVSQAQLGDDEDQMKDWAIDAAKTCMDRITSTNFSITAYDMMLSYSRLNTGVMYFEWNRDKGLVFREIPVTDCCLAEDSEGYVNIVIREFELTNRQAYQKWGEACHPSVKEEAKDVDKSNKKIKYLHFVTPRKDYKSDSMNKMDMPFKSCYVNLEKKHLVEEGGYSYFPYATPRFLHNKQMPYGRGQSFTALDVMRVLTKMGENIDDGVELGVNPPVFSVGPGGEKEDIDLRPGAWNYLGSETKIEHYQTNLDLPNAMGREQQKEQEVRNLFFNDVFVTIEGEAALKNVTATAIDFLRAERIQALLPIVNRLYDEFYSPLLKGVLQILVENGEISPPPSIDIKNLRVEFSTKLDQKLKLQDSQQILQGLMEVQQIYTQMIESTDLKHLINVDEIARDLFRNKNVSPKYIKSEDETNESRAAEAQAMQAQQNQQMIMDKVGQADPLKKPEGGSMVDLLGEA